MIKATLIISLLTAILGLSCTASANDDLRKAVAIDYDKNHEALFTHFHQNPELSFKENKTAARLGKELSILGFTVTQGVGKTGIVAVMENGPGLTVMIRADMDGLYGYPGFIKQLNTLHQAI